MIKFPPFTPYKLLPTRGYAALFSFVVMLAIIVGIGSVFSAITFKSALRNRSSLFDLKNTYAAEGFLEDTLRRIYDNSLNDPVQGESLILDGVTTTLNLANLAEGQQYSFSSLKDKYFKTMALFLDDGSSSASFNYAMQIGAGGLEMGNGSRIEGSIFSNGSVNGGGDNIITGSASLAGTSILDNVTVNQNAQAFGIADSTIGQNATAAEIVHSTISGNATANILSNCTVGQNAFYNTLTNCTVGGQKNTPIIAPANLAPLDFPITLSQMILWQENAASGGIITGNYNISANATLGPKKITGDLTINGGVTLNVAGTIWVLGKLIAGNNSIIKLDASYGSNSGIIMADGPVDFGNNIVFSGSRMARSYVMIISRAVSPQKAFDLGNGVSGAILYAPYGDVDIGNNIEVKEVSAYKLELGNNSVLKYENGLKDVKFSGGSAAAIKIKDWREVE